MNDSPLDFSVVIPSHFRLEKLTALLNSLESQTLSKSHFEVIVVASENDPSLSLKDSSTHWSYSLQITSIPQDPFSGKSASAKRNYGTSLAKAEWIAFIDDDCVAQPLWLEKALDFQQKHNHQAIEGYTYIPLNDQPSLSHRGMKRFSAAGGYQTCNMFYHKKTFTDLGGFDNSFPYYLEDSDLAWTFLDADYSIGFCKEAVIEHPVGEADSKKLWTKALRMSKLPHLYKKHPDLYKKSNIVAFPRSYFIFLINDLSIIYALGFLSWESLLWLFALRLALTIAYVTRLFRGCHFKIQEFLSVSLYSLICPLAGFFQLMRGNILNRTFLFYK